MTDGWSVDLGSVSEVMGINVPATGGGASVTVHGSGMGSAAYTDRAREGHTACEASDWVSDTAVRCRLGQGAQGSRRGVVTAGEGSGSLADAWSVDAAGMSEVVGINVGGGGRGEGLKGRGGDW